MGMICTRGSFCEGNKLRAALSRGSGDRLGVFEVCGVDRSEQVVSECLELSGDIGVRDSGLA